MRKTIFMIALIVGASFTTANATETTKTTTNPYKVEVTKASKVNPFCMAIVKGDVATVKKMIQFGENVNKTSNGKTPLMYAARYNRVEIANLLIANGANTSVKDKLGKTAADYAEISKAMEVKKVITKSAR